MSKPPKRTRNAPPQIPDDTISGCANAPVDLNRINSQILLLLGSEQKQCFTEQTYNSVVGSIYLKKDGECRHDYNSYGKCLSNERHIGSCSYKKTSNVMVDFSKNDVLLWNVDSSLKTFYVYALRYFRPYLEAGNRYSYGS